VLRCADLHAGRLRELEINPLIALPHGALAVDAVIRLVDSSSDA
jgi:succinyl-CoA synthetase beta subunit